jgi:hypothetical protein
MKTIAAARLALLCAAAAGALPVGAAGCGDRSDAVCDAVCDCQECTNREYGDCLDDAGDTLRAADNKACGGKADAYLACVESNLQCSARRIDVSGCDGEYEELVACGVAAPSLGASCELGLKRLEECFGAGSGGQFGDCANPAICGLPCYASATCTDIQSGQSQELNECLAQCSQPIPPDEPPRR